MRSTRAFVDTFVWQIVLLVLFVFSAIFYMYYRWLTFTKQNIFVLYTIIAMFLFYLLWIFLLASVYRGIEKTTWIDSFATAIGILTGQGFSHSPRSPSAKIILMFNQLLFFAFAALVIATLAGNIHLSNNFFFQLIRHR